MKLTAYIDINQVPVDLLQAMKMVWHDELSVFTRMAS